MAQGGVGVGGGGGGYSEGEHLGGCLAYGCEVPVVCHGERGGGVRLMFRRAVSESVQ